MADIKAFRWDGKQYVPYKIPEGCNCRTFSPDLSEKVNCINCGKELTYGESYTSHQFHDQRGFGFAECEDCYYDYMPEYLRQKKYNLE